jgi:hypothetical protein
MGALANLNAYKSARSTARRCRFAKNFASLGGAQLLASQWLSAPNAGLAPSTPAACNKDTPGSLLQSDNIATVTGEYWALASATAVPQSASVTNVFLVCDRLSHQGGLSGIVTTAQTTNLPTAALTRNTTGADVMMGVEIYAQIGSTATTITASYTNQAGVAGKITQAVVFGGGSGNQAVSRFYVATLADGDTGVRSVESVTVAATTGTAGNFGVVLFKPIMMLPALAFGNFAECDALLRGAYIPKFPNDACPFVLNYSNTTGAPPGPLVGWLELAEA